jgi:hypothetical protein
VVKIACFYSEVVLRTINNYKAHYSYPGSGPCDEVISLRPAFFIGEQEQCYNVVSCEFEECTK